MPAEEHVEPLAGLPDRGACGGSTGCAESGVRTGHTQGRIGSPRRRTCQAGSRNHTSSGCKGCSKHDGQEADQCAGCRDPQRLPLRLSKSVRRGPDRRFRGTEMSGTEQVEGFGALPAGDRRGRRRCGDSCRRRGCYGSSGDCRSCRRPCRCAGARIGAAAAAAARGDFRLEVYVWR